MSLLQLKRLDPEIMNVRLPVRVKHVLIKRYHRQRLYELSLKLVGRVPQLDELTEEQSQWVKGRMQGPARSWERWFVGQYFTQEQKKQLGLTDLDIEGRGMA